MEASHLEGHLEDHLEDHPEEHLGDHRGEDRREEDHPEGHPEDHPEEVRREDLAARNKQFRLSTTLIKVTCSILLRRSVSLRHNRD